MKKLIIAAALSGMCSNALASWNIQEAMLNFVKYSITSSNLVWGHGASND